MKNKSLLASKAVLWQSINIYTPVKALSKGLATQVNWNQAPRILLVRVVKVHGSGKLPAQQGSSHSVSACPPRCSRFQASVVSTRQWCRHWARPSGLLQYAFSFIPTVSLPLHLLLQWPESHLLEVRKNSPPAVYSHQLYISLLPLWFPSISCGFRWDGALADKIFAVCLSFFVVLWNLTHVYSNHSNMIQSFNKYLSAWYIPGIYLSTGVIVIIRLK